MTPSPVPVSTSAAIAAADDDRDDQDRRRDVGRAIEPERERHRRAEDRDEDAGKRIADHVGEGLATQSAELAVSRSSPGTIRGRIATRAGRKKTEMLVMRKTSG